MLTCSNVLTLRNVQWIDVFASRV